MVHYSGYMICSASGNVRYVKTLMNANVRPSEISVPIGFDIPDSAFQKPSFRLAIKVDAVNPVKLSPELIEKARVNLETELGMRIELAAPEAPPCIACNGKGLVQVISGALEPCQVCGGSGVVQ